MGMEWVLQGLEWKMIWSTCWAQNCGWSCERGRHSSWHNFETGNRCKWKVKSLVVNMKVKALRNWKWIKECVAFAPAWGYPLSHLGLCLGQRSCSCPHPRSTWPLCQSHPHPFHGEKSTKHKILEEKLGSVHWLYLLGSPSPPLNLIPL